MQKFSVSESVVIFEAGSSDDKLARTAEAQVELLPYIGLGVWPGEEPCLPGCQFSWSCARKQVSSLVCQRTIGDKKR